MKLTTRTLFCTFIAVFLNHIQGFAIKKPQAFFSYCTFYAPGKGPYVETYLTIVGNSIRYVKNENGKFQGTLNITIAAKQDSVIKYTDHYNLLSQELEDTVNVLNFIDQQRITLPNGDYDLCLTIGDKNNSEKPFTSVSRISVKMGSDSLSLSDIQLVESFTKVEHESPLTKNGYDLVPYVSNFYPAELNSLKFYAELYNAQHVLGQTNYLIRYYLENSDNGRILPEYNSFFKQTAHDVNVIMAEFPIGELGSGNFNLVIEVRSRENKLLARRTQFFQRSKKIEPRQDNDTLYSGMNINNTFVASMTNRDTLLDYVHSLRPISNDFEKNFEDAQNKKSDPELLRQFLYSFWYKKNNANPQLAWEQYNSEVKAVNNSFGTRITKGYDTDRGRVYLQYGRPNTISSNVSDPDAYPYEIWQYNTIKNQSNKKFVFYNPDLVTNDYTLIHSDANGETYDRQWQYKIHKRTTQGQNGSPDSVGDNKLDGLISNPH